MRCIASQIVLGTLCLYMFRDKVLVIWNGNHGVVTSPCIATACLAVAVCLDSRELMYRLIR